MICVHCSKKNEKTSKFCISCGKNISKKTHINHTNHIGKITFFFVVLLLYIAIINFVEFEIDYKKRLIIDAIFASFVLLVAIIDYKNILPLLKLKNLKVKPIIAILLLAPALAYGIENLSSYLNKILFNEVASKYYYDFIFSSSPLFLTTLSVGIIPSIFEEIAFRGFVFKELFSIFSLKVTILITTVLFTILHLSFISFVWIFPLGIVFGYLRARYRTLWYSIFAHFTYNTSIVLIEYFNL
jgi:membrane protease YdiL (CAAX protease family)